MVSCNLLPQDVIVGGIMELTTFNVRQRLTAADAQELVPQLQGPARVLSTLYSKGANLPKAEQLLELVLQVNEQEGLNLTCTERVKLKDALYVMEGAFADTWASDNVSAGQLWLRMEDNCHSGAATAAATASSSTVMACKSSASNAAERSGAPEADSPSFLESIKKSAAEECGDNGATVHASSGSKRKRKSRAAAAAAAASTDAGGESTAAAAAAAAATTAAAAAVSSAVSAVSSKQGRKKTNTINAASEAHKREKPEGSGKDKKPADAAAAEQTARSCTEHSRELENEARKAAAVLAQHHSSCQLLQQQPAAVQQIAPLQSLLQLAPWRSC
jgi:hypothetical protein